MESILLSNFVATDVGTRFRVIAGEVVGTAGGSVVATTALVVVAAAGAVDVITDVMAS
jgi:hypothetical protein